MLYQDRNVGVNYEYSIPSKISQRGDPDGYNWIADEFSACSSTCGGGIQIWKHLLKALYELLPKRLPF